MSNKKKILVIGSAGQLGSTLKEIANLYSQYEFYYTSRIDFDITDFNSLRNYFDENQYDYCFNFSAYTKVDLAETEIEEANKINYLAVSNIVKMCNDTDTCLVHISTDYVFSGEGNIPVTEEDITKPLNIYGSTKLAGEQFITANSKKFMIIRTSWLYSHLSANFVKTMLHLSESRSELRIIADQTGTPTYAVDLAKALMDIVSKENIVNGVYHFSNEGVTSWYDFACAIFRIAGKEVNVFPISTSEYPVAAKRPVYSVMSKNKIKSTYGISIRNWYDALEECLKKL